MKKLAWAFVAVALVMLGVGIFESRKTNAPVVAIPETVIKPIDDTNGVYYFPISGDRYRRSLGQFYADNPGLACEYQGATEELRGTTSLVVGHILHCYNHATPAQDTTVP
jgi:hypothetical protein